jgi:FixJ family two-component response regulator
MISVHEERPRVLIVDDEKFIRDILADFLGMEGYIVRTAEDGTAALGELAQARYDMVISDLKMPRMGGLELLAAIGDAAPNALTVIMTGFGTVESAIDAMKRGAYDYILKPFKVEEVIHVVQRGLEKQRLSAENLRLREALSLYKVSEAITASLSLDEVLATVGDAGLHEIDGDLVSTWLDDGEGGFFERQRLVQPVREDPELAARAERGRVGFGEFSPAAFIEHFANDTTLLEHGAKGERFFATKPEAPLTSLVAVPLRMKGRVVGWICVASFSKNKRFDEGQRKLLSIVGSRAAAAIENARLYEDLRATFQQTIRGLAKAIDKMDRYTSGHSDRVAVYATYLAIPGGCRRDRPSERADARHRQARLRHELEQAGKAHAGRVRDLQAASGVRQGHPRPDQVPPPAHPRRPSPP